MSINFTVSEGVFDMLWMQALIAVVALPLLTIVRVEKILADPAPMQVIALLGYIYIFTTNAMFLWQASKTKKPAAHH